MDQVRDEQLVSDEDILHAFGNANFGHDAVPRDIVNRAVLQAACGFADGHTISVIIRELGLAVKAKRGNTLTRKGKDYLWALHGTGCP